MRVEKPIHHQNNLWYKLSAVSNGKAHHFSICHYIPSPLHNTNMSLKVGPDQLYSGYNSTYRGTYNPSYPLNKTI